MGQVFGIFPGTKTERNFFRKILGFFCENALLLPTQPVGKLKFSHKSPAGAVKSPAGRKPSPPGKVDRAQPGPDEGKQPKSEKQATLNGCVFHLTQPVLLLGYGPSSVTPYGVPPSPWGKASSGGGRLPPAGAVLSEIVEKCPDPCRLKKNFRKLVEIYCITWYTIRIHIYI